MGSVRGAAQAPCEPCRGSCLPPSPPRTWEVLAGYMRPAALVSHSLLGGEQTGQNLKQTGGENLGWEGENMPWLCPKADLYKCFSLQCSPPHSSRYLSQNHTKHSHGTAVLYGFNDYPWEKSQGMLWWLSEHDPGQGPNWCCQRHVCSALMLQQRGGRKGRNASFLERSVSRSPPELVLPCWGHLAI